MAQLVSIDPEALSNGDLVISLKNIKEKIYKNPEQALIIRTLPNPESRLKKNYSGTNPVYLQKEAAEFIRKTGIDHLLVDQPSVDREQDEGKLLAHKEFWNYPSNPRIKATITEFIFVPSSIPDGKYFINIQIASLENDASPSKILLFDILT